MVGRCVCTQGTHPNTFFIHVHTEPSYFKHKTQTYIRPTTPTPTHTNLILATTEAYTHTLRRVCSLCNSRTAPHTALSPLRWWVWRRFPPRLKKEEKRSSLRDEEGPATDVEEEVRAKKIKRNKKISN